MRRMISRRAMLHCVAGAAGLAVGDGWPARLSAQTGDAATVARIDADLVRHAGFGDKFSGSEGDRATAAWIAGRLRRAGYRVDESSFDAPFFVKRSAKLSAGDAVADVLPQAPVVTTGASGVSAPLALVEGAVRDVRECVALVVLPSGRHAALFPDRGIGQTVLNVARAGARAIVLVTTGPSGEAVALNSPADAPFVPVPMAILAPRRAGPFIAAARAQGRATLIVDGEATHRPSPNVVARIERGERWIAISTPRSGWFSCVGERGTGTSVFLELADWAMARFPRHSIFLMNTGGHEYFFAGSHRALAAAPPPAATAVWAHIGATLAARDAREENGRLVLLDTPDPQRSLMATEPARAAAAGSFTGLAGLETPTPVRPQAGELSTFTDLGYRTAFAVIGVHRWFHTVADTIDKVDARLVLPVLQAHQRTIEQLTN
jgi:hypothetical protein